MELLIATIRHFYSNEKLIQSKLSEFFKSDSSAASKLPKASGSGSESGNRTSTSAASAPTNPPTDAPPPPPSHPSVNPLFLQQLMDMGFPQVHAEDALIACGNDLPSAMDWILTHPHAASNSAATAATNVSCVEFTPSWVHTPFAQCAFSNVIAKAISNYYSSKIEFNTSVLFF